MPSAMQNPVNFFSKSSLSLFDSLNIPLAIADKNKELIWHTKVFASMIEGNILGVKIDQLFDLDTARLDSDDVIVEENLFWEVRIISTKEKHDKIGYIIYLEENKQTSDKLSRRVKSIKNFAHDLNNILTSISNSASFLKSNYEKGEYPKHLLDTLEINSQRAADIIQQVLSENTSRESIKKKVDLRQLLEELENSLQNIVRSDINIKMNIDNDLSFITSNYSDIYRVLLNLSINSSEAIRRKGTISISASNINSNSLPANYNKSIKQYVKITVKDNGSGIRKKHIHKVFNPEFSTKIRNRESGLGLNIVKSIITDHNGYIEVKSKWLLGTEFVIYLPARDMFQKSELTANNEKIILIADDEETILELLTDLLESYNYKVIKTRNGLEVLNILQTETEIDLMIIDRKMPAMNGIECIRKLRVLNYKNPIILTSGSQSILNDDAISELSVNRIMTKPYDFKELLEEIKILLN
ncbi:MAG: hypothetical protein CVV23_01505 [Ignavibacteriae bacterium HGW-Ignavibacteriae-2]|jgi:signal transduction histidine kinase|nr:MAG: hypothetical protein CVV23_01505 [Ignavibacteriae bacterium HGW-Ignavibacteriae-2]